MKKCNICGSVSNKFYAKEARCNICVSKIRRLKYKESPEKHRLRANVYRQKNPEKIRDTKLRQAYGVGIDYFNAKLKEQGEVCAGCGKNRKVIWQGKEVEMALDHNHITKEPRGILCIKCNRAYGLLEENIQTMLNLIEYTNKYKK
jgi:hypothetical protein